MGSAITTRSEGEAKTGAHAVLKNGAGVFIPLEGVIDLEKERDRLAGEIERLTGQLRGVQGKLENRNFVERAPEEVVGREREKEASFREQIEKLQEKLKVFISVDMEGIAGVVNGDQTSSSGKDYGIARRWMTEEVNAAIRGAMQAGATEIVVNDSHGSMRNVIISEMNPEATLTTGSPKPLSMMQGIDETCDAVFLIGYLEFVTFGQLKIPKFRYLIKKHC